MTASSSDAIAIFAVRTGAFAEVVSSRDAQTGRAVALKTVLRPVRQPERQPAAGVGAASLEESVCREAELLRLAEHQNVVALLDVRLEGPNVVLVLEWCDTDLEQVLRCRTQPLPEAATKALFEDLLHGLAACHARGILHRDVKPANLLIGQDGRLKLADFGNACARPEAPLTPGPTTRWYRAPELLYGSRDYDSAVDVWSAGCLLAELLGGVPLLPGESDVDQLAQIYWLLGAPSEEERGWLSSLPDFHKVSFSAPPRAASLADALPDAPQRPVLLLGRMLTYTATARLSTAEALRDDWFARLPLPWTRGEVLELVK